MLIDRIAREIRVGTQIPKPQSLLEFTFLGVCEYNGERAVAYSIPPKTKGGKTREKKLTASQLEAAFQEFCRGGEITKSWWTENVSKSEAEGGCNFTSFGGLLILLGQAERAGRGMYRRLKS